MSNDAAACLEQLPVERRETVELVHGLIRSAVPHLDERLWDYGGGLIGYWTYHYRTGAGAEGDWFASGSATASATCRSTAARDGRYLTDAYADRFPVRQELHQHHASGPAGPRGDQRPREETAEQFAGQYLTQQNP